MFFDCHTHSKSDINTFIIDISEDFQLPENVEMFSVGIHPKTEKSDDEIVDNLRIISCLADTKSCVAIGECGLDKFSPSNLQRQEKIFRAQIAIAQEFRKPLIIHCVRLYSEVQRILKDTKFNGRVIFHGYNGNPEVTKQLLKNMDVMFSFSAVNTNENCKGFQSLKIIPPERILTESDCDKCTDFSLVVKQIAKAQGVGEQEMGERIKENFRSAFDARI